MGTDVCGREVAPLGLVVDRVERATGSVRVFARTGRDGAVCPCCGVVSRKVRSRYGRQLADLPAHGRHVVISVEVRRFLCAERDCVRRIFAERLEPSVAGSFSRRTERLDGLVQHLGRALGGRPGQRMARRLLLPVSKDTLLRTVRRRAAAPQEAPKIIGVDDWAWRKGHRYGTLICDLERRRVIDLLPDREPATVAAWLAARPSIEIIARDRGGSYGAAAEQGRPEALQVADRWHLFENASAAFLSAVRRQMGAIRAALGQGPVDPSVLTSAERLQHEGWRRRAEARARWCATSFVAAAPSRSARARARSSRGSIGSTPSGRAAAATGPNSGGGCAVRGFRARCASSANGRPGAAATSRPAARAVVRAHALSPDCFRPARTCCRAPIARSSLSSRRRFRLWGRRAISSTDSTA